MASEASVAISTARRFKTGRLPGNPKHTGHTFEFGASPNRFAHPQKIFVAVNSCTCTSSPMTGSYLASISGAIAPPSDAVLPHGESAIIASATTRPPAIHTQTSHPQPYAQAGHSDRSKPTLFLSTSLLRSCRLAQRRNPSSIYRASQCPRRSSCSLSRPPQLQRRITLLRQKQRPKQNRRKQNIPRKRVPEQRNPRNITSHQTRKVLRVRIQKHPHAQICNQEKLHSSN